MNKKKLIVLAKKKGFTSKFLYNWPYLYSPIQEKLRWLFWLVELKMWLLKNHDEFVDDLIKKIETKLNTLPDGNDK